MGFSIYIVGLLSNLLKLFLMNPTFLELMQIIIALKLGHKNIINYPENTLITPISHNKSNEYHNERIIGDLFKILRSTFFVLQVQNGKGS